MKPLCWKPYMWPRYVCLQDGMGMVDQISVKIDITAYLRKIIIAYTLRLAQISWLGSDIQYPLMTLFSTCVIYTLFVILSNFVLFSPFVIYSLVTLSTHPINVPSLHTKWQQLPDPTPPAHALCTNTPFRLKRFHLTAILIWGIEAWLRVFSQN